MITSEQEVYETYTHIEHPEHLPVSLLETLAMLFLPLIGLAVVTASILMGIKWMGG